MDFSVEAYQIQNKNWRILSEEPKRLVWIQNGLKIVLNDREESMLIERFCQRKQRLIPAIGLRIVVCGILCHLYREPMQFGVLSCCPSYDIEHLYLEIIGFIFWCIDDSKTNLYPCTYIMSDLYHHSSLLV